MVIDGYKVPPYYFIGNSSNSNDNDQFLKMLSATFDLSKSCIDKYNFAIDTSSTYYITRKIFDINTQKDKISPFIFNKDSNNIFRINFGYKDEILGKSIFAINFESISNYFSPPINHLNKEVKVYIESDLKVHDNNFSIDELFSLIQFTETITINQYGILVS
jgi:hypothetical protein